MLLELKLGVTIKHPVEKNDERNMEKKKKKKKKEKKEEAEEEEGENNGLFEFQGFYLEGMSHASRAG